MAGNTFGTLYRLTSFGESHGSAMGGIIDGCPSGIEIDFAFINSELARRRPGQSSIVSQRKEKDEVEFLSGIYNGKTTGTPIGFIIKNKDIISSDYDHLSESYRPSHADYTYEKKYGMRDHRGGGRASVRETIARIIAGAIAKLILKTQHISIVAYTSQIGNIKLLKHYTDFDFSIIENNAVRCPDVLLAETMMHKIEQIKAEGDSIGGAISCIIKGVPAGIGEPVFDKLHADLGKAMLSINAVKGFEFGSGFDCIEMKGSEHNDVFYKDIDGKIKTKTNHSGGIQGGISNGEDIYFRIAFKPVSTIMKPQTTIDKRGNTALLDGKGRHDPCVVPRAVPIVEAMAAMVILDHWLRNKTVFI